MRTTAALLAALVVVAAGAGNARARRRARAAAAVPAESFSVALSAGLEAMPDSIGAGFEPLGLFGLSGTIRVARTACLDARFGAGATEDGSDTTRVSETRLRLDVRSGFCPALHQAITLFVGAGPATALSLHQARVRDSSARYSAFDLGLTAAAAVLFRLGPFLIRLDGEAGVLRRFLFGFFLGLGVAI